MWSPGAHMVRSRVSSAASPEAKASPRAPPSIAARHSSSAVRVGLAERLYSYPPRSPPTPSCLYVEVWWIGTTTDPVLGSGCCPAWIASVSNPYRSSMAREATPVGGARTPAGSRAEWSVRVQGLDDRGVGGEDAAALEFHRRGELRGVGQPLVRQDRELLDALDLGDPAVDLRHAAFQLGPDLRGGRELGEPGRQALPGGPAGRDLGVQDEQRDQVAPPVADHARLADQRQRLEHRLQVRRGHVLAARRDD